MKHMPENVPPKSTFGRFTLALLAAGATGCSQEPTIPKLDDEPVTMTIAASTRNFTLGKEDTIRVTITNFLDQVARLGFGSSCQVDVYIRSLEGVIVLPSGGRPLCLPGNTTLDIPAQGSITRSFVWDGRDSFVPTISTAFVQPGTYFISAEINALNYSTFVPALKVEVARP